LKFTFIEHFCYSASPIFVKALLFKDEVFEQIHYFKHEKFGRPTKEKSFSSTRLSEFGKANAVISKLNLMFICEEPEQWDRCFLDKTEV